MKTSSSDGAIGRTLARLRPAASTSAAAAGRAGAVARSIRTCARSPNICTSATPGMRAQHLGRAPVIGDDDLEERAGQRRAQRVGPIEREQPSLVQQRDARAALGLVEVRRRHHDR